MDRSLAVGATGGSLSALLFRLLSASLEPSSCPACDFACDCQLCPELPTLIINHLDLFSVGVGIGIGLVIGPLLDLIHLIRQSWTVWLRTRLTQLSEEKPLYKIA